MNYVFVCLVPVALLLGWIAGMWTRMRARQWCPACGDQLRCLDLLAACGQPRCCGERARGHHVMSGPFTEDPTLTPVDRARLYSDILEAHADDSGLGRCVICEQSRCDIWRFAYGELVKAGDLPGAHERWRDLAEPETEEQS
jgi:hypothetical protein